VKVVDQVATKRKKVPVNLPQFEVATLGAFVRVWGSPGSGQGQFNRPRAITVAGDLVFVVDQATNRIQVLNVDGTFVRVWGSRGSGQGQFNSPRGIAVAGDLVIVVDYNNDRIQVFN
jgi:DNA-binding beta-propeller fold protein YncE